MKQHIINPTFVPLVSLFVFSIAFFYPSEAWENTFGEPNHAYLDIKSLVYILSCLIMYYLGLTITMQALPTGGNGNLKTGRVNIALLLIPVLSTTILVFVIYLYYLITNYQGYIFLSITGHGAQAKQMIIDDQINFNSIVNYAIPILWWAWFRYYSQAKQFYLASFSHILTRIMLGISTALLIIIMIINVARFAFIPLFIGLFLIYSHLRVYKTCPPSRHLGVSIKLFLYLAFGLLFFFALFAIARGSAGHEQLVEMILGYGPASFNRLSATLNGDLNYEYSKTGVYLVPEPFFYISTLILGTEYTSSLSVWLSEFKGVAMANLNENFIWMTVFGYAYNTIGILAIAYFVAYGALTAFLWRAFIFGRLHGIILYPLAYFSIFFLFGYNYFVIFFPYYIFILLIVLAWETLLATFTTKMEYRHVPE